MSHFHADKMYVSLKSGIIGVAYDQIVLPIVANVLPVRAKMLSILGTKICHLGTKVINLLVFGVLILLSYHQVVQGKL